VDGAREYYAKRNKPVREGQIPYGLTHMWNLRKQMHIWEGGKGNKP